MGDGSPQELGAGWIGAEAQQRHGLPPRAPGRDAELALEAARLNDAVRSAAGELGFDDQPGDFAALLESLREPDAEAS